MEWEKTRLDYTTVSHKMCFSIADNIFNMSYTIIVHDEHCVKPAVLKN